MKVFVMRDMMLGKNGFFTQKNKLGIPFLKAPSYYIPDLNQVLVIDEGTMYVTKEDSGKLPKLLETLAKHDNDTYRALNKMHQIELRKIKKVLIRPYYTLPNGELVNTQLQFYRALHLDTVCQMEISSLWLLNKEVAEILSGHVTKPGIRSDVEKINDYIVPRKRRDKLLPDEIERIAIGDGLIPWNEEKRSWDIPT